MAAKTFNDFAAIAGAAAAAGDKIPLWDLDGSPNDKTITVEELLKKTFLPPGALIAIIEDQKTSSTAGGTFTNGADRTRDLNQLVYVRNGLVSGTPIVSIASNQFTIAEADDYEIEWYAPARRVDDNQSFLYNITGSAEVKRGTSGRSDNTSPATDFVSMGATRVTIGVATTYEIRHRCSTSFSTSGFGAATNFGTEVYTRVVIRKG
jgi:hypothetical protein